MIHNSIINETSLLIPKDLKNHNKSNAIEYNEDKDEIVNINSSNEKFDSHIYSIVSGNGQGTVRRTSIASLFSICCWVTIPTLIIITLSIVWIGSFSSIKHDLHQYLPNIIWYTRGVRYHHHSHVIYHHHIDHDDKSDSIPKCGNDPCFRPPQPDSNTPQVATNRPGFPSYWNYATGRNPIKVSYDERSILLNGDRVLLIGGSMHPSRATPATWEVALDHAVDNGLNLITVYVMWGAHQPTANSTLDWNLYPRPITDKSIEWSVASSIRSAAKRGLFVHIRIGPFVCAEYNYGGIPEWVPLSDPDMIMRRYNDPWMRAMEQYVTALISYLQGERLFAYQGGPIILAQIENEINDSSEMDPLYKHQDDDSNYFNDAQKEDTDDYYSYFWNKVTGKATTNREVDSRRQREKTEDRLTATLQDYAEWSGQLAKKLAPDVVWTMCNGLSASNTIETYNGQFFDTSWLDHHGDSKRIQIDRPALWTEHEGGFQIWGDDPDNPSDYFSGETARAMSYSTVRWLARGGSHINYYMFWGGYNRERAAGAGITNSYATDAVLCSSGQPHQPKFDHFASLANAVAKIASTLLDCQSALGHEVQLFVENDHGRWIRGKEQVAFYYETDYDDDDDYHEVVFVENAASETYVVEVPVKKNGSSRLYYSRDFLIFKMQPYSAIIIVDGYVRFDSSDIDTLSMSFKRRYDWNPVTLRNWNSISEPIGASEGDQLTQTSNVPIEQTALHVQNNVSSDYVWYETEFYIYYALDSLTLFVDTQISNAFLVYIDNEAVGHADTHLHKDGKVTLSVFLGDINSGSHRISMLSESLGYYNVIGAWNVSARAKTKGITGQVRMSSALNDEELNLTDGRDWRSFANLHLSPTSLKTRTDSISKDIPSSGPKWISATFLTPDYDQSREGLFINVRVGRGHLFLNGNDLGRYWNITRSDGKTLSQEYYLLPNDYLYQNGRENSLVFFDVFGSRLQDGVSLVISWIEPSNSGDFSDEVGFTNSCI